MVRTSPLQKTASKAKQRHAHLPETLRSVLIASRKWAASPLVMLFLVASTLVLFTSCGVIPSTSAVPTPASVIPNPYPPHQGTLALNDPLKDNSRGFKWDVEKDACQFAKNGYHVSTSVDLYSFWCAAYGTNFNNFAYEAQMTILKGDSGGLFFRGDADNAKCYYFRIDHTGYFMFITFTGHTSASLLKEGTASSFHQGMGQSNLIGVVAQGKSFMLYVNHRQVASVTNPTFSQGQIGLVASDYQDPVEVVFTDAKVWKL